MTHPITRRDALRGLAAGAAGLAAQSALPGLARAQNEPPAPPAPDPRFLIVLTATGGASIIDAMLAIRASESRNAATINTFPDAMVQSIDGSPFRAIDQNLRDLGPLPYRGDANQSDFVRRHAADMMVVTHTGTSVNHLIAQKRALTGNEAHGGRTLQELVAATYGHGFLVPNVNMSVGGYIEPGIDTTLPDHARGEPVTDATTWFSGLHGSRGILGAPASGLIERARATRGRIDDRSVFARTFPESTALTRWRRQRGQQAPAIEGADLITRMNILPDAPPVIPLSRYGLASSPDAARVREAFPLFASDPLDAQGALAYMLLTNGVSVTVTLGPGLSPGVGGQQIVDSPPLAFDFSHTAHRGTQALMWSRLLSVADRLIGLLQGTEFRDGQSYWDRSLLYVATDFGRTRNRPANANEFSSGHHLNNGSLIVSPFVNGNRVLGGVDPDTGLTYGFDPRTGDPERGRNMAEREIFAGIAQALGVDTAAAGLPDVPAMRRG
ncbi:MAG: hypothetical protein R3F65_31785 [bacterium]